jgi:hypothetical protein
MALKLFKAVIAILLLPTAYAVTRIFAGQLLNLEHVRQISRDTAWFAGGFIAWFLLFALFPRPIRTYVFAHELTHALWGLLMGARVSRLKVSKKGGSVTLNKTNFLITLAPYFFPFYSVLALALYVLLALWLDMSAYLPFWYGLFGLTWAFHLSFTAMMLGIHQPDIHEHGRLFSYAVIYIVNLFTASFLLHFLTGQQVNDWAVQAGDEIILAYRQSSSIISTGLPPALEKLKHLLQ